MVQEAPEDLRNGKLFSEVVNMSKGKIVPSTETDIHAKIEEYLQKEDFQKKIKSFRKEIEEIRAIKPNERSERMLNLAEDVMNMFEKKNFSEVESMVEKLFEQKFYETEVFTQLEHISELNDKIVKDKGTIEANKNKLRRSLESIKAKDIQSYDILGALVRLKVKEAKSIIVSIKKSYAEFGGTPDKEIEKI